MELQRIAHEAGKRRAEARASSFRWRGLAIALAIPIVVYFGDNIPEEASPNPGQDNWRVRLAMARLWRDAVNRHGGDVTLVHLPDLGIRGNTHFPFSDTNNIEIADLLSKFLAQKQLDGGPRR
jgi:hypothetical protein